MKVKIVTNKGSWSCANTGKGFFIQRLIKSMIDKGVDVTCKPDDSADIELGIGKFITQRKRVRRRVVRIGPSHFDTSQDWRGLNKRKSAAVREADGVIYQSKWSQKVGRIYLGDGKLERVILNGDKIFDRAKQRLGMNTAIMSTRKWIPQKRLKHALRVFHNTFKNTQAKLSVFGECDKKLVRKFGSDLIRFHGPQTQDVVQMALSQARFMIHPVWLDACPNSVVEALAHNCPVLTSNQGGTTELVSCNCGAAIQEDDWDFKPVNLQKPPPLDDDMWSTGMMAMFAREYKQMKISHIDINNIADQYIEFFEEVLDG